MSAFAKQCMMQKKSLGIFADLMSDSMNRQRKEEREGGGWEGGNEESGRSELNVCSILKMITLEFSAI